MNKERASRAPRTQAEEKLLQALRVRLALDGLSISEIERRVGLGHGTLANVLRGRSELRLHHLEALGHVLGFTLPEIVAEAYGARLSLGTPATRRPGGLGGTPPGQDQPQ